MALTGKPIVIAYHLIWTAYGWWLPNDPRGSGSQLIRSDVLRDLGELHLGRKAIQPAGSVREFYEQAAGRLRHPLLSLGSAEMDVVGRAFGDVVAEQRYTCWGCAVMPEHGHILIRKHKHSAEEMIENLKTLSRKRLWEMGGAWRDHPVWATGYGWKVFLDHPDEVWRTIRYIEGNPVKLGGEAQPWHFASAYDNWPLHPGHSPNSPYAVALRAAGRL